MAYLSNKNKRNLALIAIALSVGLLFDLPQLTGFSVAGFSSAFIVALIDVYVAYMIWRNEV